MSLGDVTMADFFHHIWVNDELTAAATIGTWSARRLQRTCGTDGTEWLCLLGHRFQTIGGMGEHLT